jgi:hypothetical protein
MNRKLFHRLYLLLWVFVPLIVFAQPKLSINYLVSFPPDTVYYPNTSFITYKMAVENVGNNQLTSSCRIMFRYDGSTTDTTVWQWSVTNFEVGQVDTVVFPDSIGLLNAGRYKGGGNILVIWPHADQPNTQAPDTTGHWLYIVDLSNGVVDPAVLAQRVEVFPNPVQDELTIRYLQRQHKLEYVRIVSMDGRLVWESHEAMEEVDMRTMPAGMYMVVFKYKDGMLGAVRITKQE